MAMLTYLLVDMATVNTYASVFVTYAMDVFIRTRGALEHSTSTPACHPAATFVQPSCNLRATFGSHRCSSLVPHRPGTMRAELAQRNIASKTLLDDRFLL